MHHFNCFLNFPTPNVMPLTRPELAQINTYNRFAHFQKPSRHIIWIYSHLKHGWQKTSKRNHVKLSNSTILTYIYTLFGDPRVDLLSKTSPHPSSCLTGSWQRSWFMILRFLNLSKSNTNLLIVYRRACLYVRVACVCALVCARRSLHAEACTPKWVRPNMSIVVCMSKCVHSSVHILVCVSVTFNLLCSATLTFRRCPSLAL